MCILTITLACILRVTIHPMIHIASQAGGNSHLVWASCEPASLKARNILGHNGAAVITVKTVRTQTGLIDAATPSLGDTGWLVI
jgi:hypothetical protein